MVINNDYIVQTYDGATDYYNCKPPLSMWMISLGYKIFGFNLIGMRFYSALSMWLMIAMLGLWLKRYGRITSLVSVGAMIATMAVYEYHYARFGDPDALYQLFFTASMLFMLSSERTSAIFMEAPFVLRWLF